MRVVNGLIYILSTGCQRRPIPKELLPKSTDYFALWTYDSTLEDIPHTLCAVSRAGPTGGQPDRRHHR